MPVQSPRGLANSFHLPRELFLGHCYVLIPFARCLLLLSPRCFPLGSAHGCARRTWGGGSPRAHPAWQGPAGIASAAPFPLQLFTDGITNKLVACYTDEDMVDAVLVRIYGRKTELFVDRETELRNFQVLRAHGCAPDLYCAFQNGLCYEFLPGIALGPDHVRDPRIFRCTGPPPSAGACGDEGELDEARGPASPFQLCPSLLRSEAVPGGSAPVLSVPKAGWCRGGTGLSSLVNHSGHH